MVAPREGGNGAGVPTGINPSTCVGQQVQPQEDNRYAGGGGGGAGTGTGGCGGAGGGGKGGGR